ncbi:alternate-type signal peptide domain-containing protein [Rhodococcus hoagii]|nr:alternate-type signal peptide domain-containing protein [Prescottella equi]
MNKKTKGAIAAGAAAVLLAGGAGTMAAWNSSASLPSATITAGELKVTEKAGTPGRGHGRRLVPTAARRSTPQPTSSLPVTRCPTPAPTP